MELRSFKSAVNYRGNKPCTKSHSACEAGVSIKPGAQAPGSDHKRHTEARETGDSVKFPVFRPLSRAPALFIWHVNLGLAPQVTWGLRPRLYAYACYRRLRNTIRFRLFVQSCGNIRVLDRTRLEIVACASYELIKEI